MLLSILNKLNVSQDRCNYTFFPLKKPPTTFLFVAQVQKHLGQILYLCKNHVRKAPVKELSGEFILSFENKVSIHMLCTAKNNEKIRKGVSSQ